MAIQIVSMRQITDKLESKWKCQVDQKLIVYIKYFRAADRGRKIGRIGRGGGGGGSGPSPPPMGGG